MRASEPALEVRLDGCDTLFDILRFAQRGDLEDGKSRPISIEALSLCGPEHPSILHEQSGIARDLGIDVERIERMCGPLVAQRGVGIEQIKLRAVIADFRLVYVRQHP